MNQSSSVDLLKSIFLNLTSPQALNNHPWALSAQVDGARLVEITIAVFRKMIPPNPPREGKRLDTRWGVFGILAAQYFAPFVLRTPPPSSLRDAWDSIDRSILLFLDEKLTEEQKAAYRFVEKEKQPAPNSTLSDWHRRGMEQLAGLLQLECEKKRPAETPRKKIAPSLTLSFFILLFLGLAFLGWKASEIYAQVRVVEQKAETLQALISPDMQVEQLPEIARQTRDLRIELDDLSAQVEPYLWMAKYCGWIPKYGETLRQAEDLLIFSRSLAAAADDGLSALSPAIETALSQRQRVEILDLVIQLNDASPKLLSAQIALARAQEARKRINTDALHPRLQKIITEKIDPLLASINGSFPLEDALTLIKVAPELLGSGKAGPQTYLILMQNEDEIRPTGGFLTAVGLAVVKDGKLLNINIDSSDKIDDFSKPYPIPPWQFEEFMNIEMLLLRDSNWFTDFPTTVSWAEYFYSYTRGASADGVIALDMNAIAETLKVVGPVKVEGVNIPISSDNVKEYLRSAEQTPPKGVDRNNWERKRFIADLAQPILEKTLNARGKTWKDLAPALLNLLDEKHLLLQFDNEEMTAFLERRNWDGAVRIPEGSDFLMAVDANMGYNKSNAVMKMTLDYSIDLRDVKRPTGTLSISQTNLSRKEIACEPQATSRLAPPSPGEISGPIYNIDECHWGYIRVYLPNGTRLTASNPQEIPDTAAWLGETIPPRTDDLGDEGIANAQVFGMMTLTPTNATTLSRFEYALPAGVLAFDAQKDLYTYKLKIQKQPGILSHEFTLKIRLPDDCEITSANIPLVENTGVWVARLDLRQDMWIKVQFR